MITHSYEMPRLRRLILLKWRCGPNSCLEKGMSSIIRSRNFTLDLSCCSCIPCQLPFSPAHLGRTLIRSAAPQPGYRCVTGTLWLRFRACPGPIATFLFLSTLYLYRLSCCKRQIVWPPCITFDANRIVTKDTGWVTR